LGKWSNGVLEYWGKKQEFRKPTPLFQYSNAPTF
jgi:hypothetical protein